MFDDVEEMKSSGDAERLFTFLQNNKDNREKGWMARLDAAEALAQLGDPRGLEYLRRMADSPNQDIREIAIEILDGLKEDQPEPVPSGSTVQAVQPATFQPESLFFLINARYPYIVAWAAFLALFILLAILLNFAITPFFALTQTWLPAWSYLLFFYLLLLYFGFLAFRWVIKLFVLPYENKR
jgi:hypothetical protein